MTIKERVQEVFDKFNVNLQAEEPVRVDMAEAALENGTVIYTDAEDFAEGEEAYIINDEGERIPLPPGDYKLADGGTISIGDLGKVNKVTKPQGGDAKNEGKPDAKGVDGKPNIDVTKRGKPTAEEAPANPPAKTPPATPPAKTPSKKPKKKLASEEEQTTTMNVELNQEEVLAVLNERFPDLGEELASAIAAAVAEVYAQPEEEVVEEEAKEEEKEEMTETTETVEATEEVAEEVEMSEQKPEKTELESLKEALEATNAKLEELQKFAAEPGLKHKAPTKKVEKLDLANMTIEERVRALANQLSK